MPLTRKLGAGAIMAILGRTALGRSDRRTRLPVRHPGMGSGSGRCGRPGNLIRSDVRRFRSNLSRLATAGRLIDSLRRRRVRG